MVYFAIFLRQRHQMALKCSILCWKNSQSWDVHVCSKFDSVAQVETLVLRTMVFISNKKKNCAWCLFYGCLFYSVSYSLDSPKINIIINFFIFSFFFVKPQRVYICYSLTGESEKKIHKSEKKMNKHQPHSIYKVL